jgi:lysozyme
MTPRLQVSRAAIEMIKRFEGYRRRAVRLPDGRWIVGYGHTRTARQGVETSEADAEALLIYDLMAVSHAIENAAHTPLTQNQFDALTSFVFNIGIDAFRHSVVLRRLNEGQHLQAACAMDLWRKAEVDEESIVVDALVRRRAAEKALFLTPPGDWTPAPTGILAPSVDHDVVGVVPIQPPADVTALVEGETVRPAVAYRDKDPMGAAAASVSARLSELYPDAPEVPEPATAAAETEAESPFAPAAGLELAEDAERDAAPARRASPSFTPLGLLALLGLALFVGGLLWAFRIAPETGVSTPGALGVGWLAGVAGVGLFSVAAYRLFERIAQAEEDEGLIA